LPAGELRGALEMLAFGQTIRQSTCNVKDPLHVTARSGLLVRCAARQPSCALSVAPTGSGRLRVDQQREVAGERRPGLRAPEGRVSASPHATQDEVAA